MKQHMTLADILREHPEWANFPIAVVRPDGAYDYVGAAATVYLDEQEPDASVQMTPVVVFATN